jgi:hypothetical protein
VSDVQRGRCPSCSALAGAQNQCLRCHAWSPLIARGEAFVCAACGSPREQTAGAICVTDAELLQALELRRGRSPVLVALGCGAPFVLAALLACFGARADEPGSALAISGLSLGLMAGGLAAFGLVLARGLRRVRNEARRRTFEIEQRIIGLAYQNDGVLREGDVSSRLRISLAEARSVLNDLVRQERAVTDGFGGPRAEFRFGEARRTRAIRRASQRPSSDQSS